VIVAWSFALIVETSIDPIVEADIRDALESTLNYGRDYLIWFGMRNKLYQFLFDQT